MNERFREAHRRARAAECQALESQKLLIRYAFGSVEARFRGMDLGSPVVLYTPYVHALKAISHTIFLAELLSHEAAGPDRDAHVAGALRDLEALRAELAAPGSEVAKLLPPDELAQQLEILTRTEDALSRFRAGRLDEAGRRAYLAAVRPLMNANLRRASAAILTRLHETVMGYKKEVDVRDPAAWASLVVIAGVSHQARAREIGVQYFERLLGESAAEGASGEDRLVVVEGQSVPADQRGTLAAHAVDRVHAGEIFGAANRLQSDVMADSSDALDVLFPTTKKTTSRVTGNAVQSKRHDARTPSPDP